MEDFERLVKEKKSKIVLDENQLRQNFIESQMSTIKDSLYIF